MNLDADQDPPPPVAPIGVACPKCPETAARGEHRDSCAACGWRDDLCVTCGKVMTWDPARRGVTCGGLEVVGWLVCCDNVEVSYSSRPADTVDWKLAKGGRSIDAGGGARIRVDGGVDVEALMARIVRLPALELELVHLRATLARRYPGAT